MGRDIILQLVKGCPHGNGCEEHCPLKKLRELPTVEAYTEIIRMTHEQVSEVEQVHNLCPRHRWLFYIHGKMHILFLDHVLTA